jgi:mRNA interferase RelE/StbE
MFRVVYHPAVSGKDIPSLDRDMRARSRKAIQVRLTLAPHYGKPVSRNLSGYWSLRVGDYRVIYCIESALVKVIQIVPRRDAYQEGVLDARRRGWL